MFVEKAYLTYLANLDSGTKTIAHIILLLVALTYNILP